MKILPRIFKSIRSAFATKSFPKESHHLDCVIFLNDQSKVKDKYNAYTLQTGVEVDGFAVPEQKRVFISWHGTDSKGEPMPDFETLGHEVWHLIKGNFHRQ